jgi:membrane-associated phospholipid phosphatase
MRPEAVEAPPPATRLPELGRRVAVPLPALLLGAFFVLAILVAAGATTGLDQYAVDHLMPGLYPYVTHRFDSSGALLQPDPLNPNRIVNRISDTVVRPATVEIVTPIVVCVLLTAKRPRGARLRWAAVFAALIAVELVGKHLIHRPPLHTTAAYGSAHVWKFDASFPSGETERAVFLAALLATAWPRVMLVPLLWAAAVLLLLVAAGTHTPTDVLGGLLVSEGRAVPAHPRPRSLSRTFADLPAREWCRVRARGTTCR